MRLLDLSKEKLKIKKQIYNETKEIVIEGDMIIPDSKPDILKPINISGNTTIYKKEAMQSRIRLDGNIDTYIMYLADSEDGKIRGLNTSLDFSEIIDIEESTQEASLTIDSKIRDLECKIINERKINIKAILEVKIKINENEEIELIEEIKEKGNMQIKNEKISINSLVGEGFSKIYGKETIKIENTEDFAEILKSNIVLINKESKLSYNKVLTKADAEVKIVYLTEENSIKTVVQKIPIVGFIDIQNVTENSNCEINYEIRNNLIKPNSSEEHSIYVELEIGVNCVAYEEKEINIIKDLYHPKCNLNIKNRNVISRNNQNNIREKNQIKENIHIEGLDQKSILDVDPYVLINNQNITSTEIRYECELKLKFILLNKSTSTVEIAIEKIPFNFVTANMSNNTNIDVFVEIGMQDYVIKDGNEVNVDVDVFFNMQSSKLEKVNNIENIEEEEERNLENYSVIIYIVKKGDSIWEIAKKYGSTVNDIMDINGMEEDNISIGQKIFIPRFYNQKNILNI